LKVFCIYAVNVDISREIHKERFPLESRPLLEHTKEKVISGERMESESSADVISPDFYSPLPPSADYALDSPVGGVYVFVCALS